MPPDPDAIWSATQAAAASGDFAELHAAHGGLLWVAFEPRQARCGLFFWRDDEVCELTPSGYSVRSRVYEYGGGACCATARGAAFVNEADQQVYLVGVAARTSDCAAPAGAHGALYQLTNRPDCRYGDLSFVPAWQALLAVEESHEAAGVIHRLVRIGLDGKRRPLVEGADFYAGPVASPDGRQLAWIEWDRPQQPWLATRLCLREKGGATQVLAGAGNDQSLQQPRFSIDGRLWVLSDRHGWWQPVRASDVCATADGAHGPGGPASPYDHAPAPWQLGGCSYLPLASGVMLLSRFEQGFGTLLERTDNCSESSDGGHGLGGPASPDNHASPCGRRLAASFSRFRALAADAEHYYCIAGAPDRLPAILAITRDSGAVRILVGGERPLDEGYLPGPQPFSCPVGEDECSHGFFYAPAGQADRPPLLVFLHGGPTSACYPVFDPRIAFWTLRGYAVLDLNYRGSSGYGRAYRVRLAGEWGRIELEDIQAAVAHLACSGLVDPARVFVRGASAGGYSALCALAFTQAFRGGASLYGVSDPLALRQVTHKFEADYLDWLIGDPQQDAERYAARTPLLHADKIAAPVIFFQGGQDAVVVPAQTESMVAALRARGVTVEYHLYPEERHGFRQARNQAHALEQEWRFYQRLLASAA